MIDWICASSFFVKLHCKSYLTKVLTSHGWIEMTSKQTSTTMACGKISFSDIHSTKGPALIEDQIELAEKMAFKYRTRTGEPLFTAITCRPEIMYAIIKLSQFSQNPHEMNYHAFKHILKYLQDTIDFGIR